MCFTSYIFKLNLSTESGESVMRLSLLRPIRYTTGGKIQNSKASESVDLNWLLLCLLIPISWWFFVVGIVAAFLPLLKQLFTRKAAEEEFEKEFHEYLLHLMILPEGVNIYDSVDLAKAAVVNPTLKEKIDELKKSMLINNIEGMDLTNTSDSFRGFVNLLQSHQEIGLSLASSLEKLSVLTEEKFYMKKRSDAKKKPVIFTYVQAAVVGALFIYMFYPLGVTILRNLVR